MESQSFQTRIKYIYDKFLIPMDPRVAKLKTTQECDAFARNARNLGHPELAEQALERSVQIRAGDSGATNEVERECLEAVYAYEEVLSAGSKTRKHASRTWQMIKRHGIIPAVERVVIRREVTMGYTSLAEMGLQEYAFEAVILRHPDDFSPEAVARSRERLKVE